MKHNYCATIWLTGTASTCVPAPISDICSSMPNSSQHQCSLRHVSPVLSLPESMPLRRVQMSCGRSAEGACSIETVLCAACSTQMDFLMICWALASWLWRCWRGLQPCLISQRPCLSRKLCSSSRCSPGLPCISSGQSERMHCDRDPEHAE